jgi:hypothetical protein
MGTFAGLLRGCISDSKENRRTREALEGAGVLLLGVVCSLATAYIFVALGVVV